MTDARTTLRLRRGIATKWLLTGVAGLAIGLGGFAFLGRGEPKDQAAIATADRTAAQVMSFEITSIAGGELEARNKVEIRSPLDRESAIVQIVAEGARVKKGDLLIQLNAEEIQEKIDAQTTRVRQARAEKVNAQNSYDIQVVENANKLRQAQMDVEVARLALDQWRYGDDTSKRQEMDLGVQRATVELERLAQRYAKSQELVAEEFLSKDEMDRDETAYIQAISEYQKAVLAKETYASYESPKDEKTKTADVEKALSELERAKLNNVSELEIKESKRDIQASEYQQAEVLLAKLVAQFENATIRAPQDGLVVYATSLEQGRNGRSEGPLQIGQRVFSNQLLIILPDTSEMVASVRVHESIAGRIRPGMPVNVKVDAAGGRTFAGQVDSIGVMAESGGWRDPNLREYTVRVALETGGAELKPAMRCEARIILDRVADALTVPVQGVFSDGPVRYVYEASGSKFIRVPVRLGRRSDTFAEIKAGIEPGRIVLLREPGAGEVISAPWSGPALTLAGYKTDDKGQVIAEGGGGFAMPGAGERRDGGEQRQPRSEGEGRGSGRSNQPAASEANTAQRTPATQPKVAAAEAPATKGEPGTESTTEAAEQGKDSTTATEASKS